MFGKAISFVLVCLLIFTPGAYGSMDIWAFSLMELGIFLIISLYAIQRIFPRFPGNAAFVPSGDETNFQEGIQNPGTKKNFPAFPWILLCLFLGLILFQMVPLPSGVVKTLSPRAFELRQLLSCSPLLSSSTPFLPPPSISLSLFPFATQLEFFKWLSLIGLFLFLLYGRVLDDAGFRNRLIIVIMLMGAGEAFYGLMEFFSGHRHILFLDDSSSMTAVSGTFINPNHFAGYLSMVIPLAMGCLLSRLGGAQPGHLSDWRQGLAVFEGKNLLLGFGIILMILGLFFSGSRMGVISLLVSFSLLAILFRDRQGGKRFSRLPILVGGLALLWGASIGMDALISRFFRGSEGLALRWMIWADTFKIMKDFPILGSGLGTFAQIFPMYRSFHIQGSITHAENDFVQLAAEAGVLGFGMLAILFLYFLGRAASGIRSMATGNPQRYIAIGGLVGVLALLLHSMVERNLQVPANAFLFSCLWAVILKNYHTLPITQHHI